MTGVSSKLQNKHFSEFWKKIGYKIIFQYHDNNIKNRCLLKIYVIVPIPIFDWTSKGKKQVKIYMWALHHKLVLFQQSMNCFWYVLENETEGNILGWTTSTRHTDLSPHRFVTGRGKGASFCDLNCLHQYIDCLQGSYSSYSSLNLCR